MLHIRFLLCCCTVVVPGCFALLLASVSVVHAIDSAVLSAEQQRIETIARICRPTLAIFDQAGEGGGSGVLISSDGYALTNFHVTAPSGPAMLCGLSDGRLVHAVIVGIDPTGDVALIKLLGHDDFPTASLGDSDTVRAGHWAYVVGNPFLLAHDFQPTVSYGIISGVHRYQYPAGTLLEYTDCLQTDAAINPGNSGGPLFDAQGKLIGINGRGSFEKRGRVNVGVGYAISINQIKRFLGSLHSGRIVDHASLGATVRTHSEGTGAQGAFELEAVVDDILEDSDAFRRGLRYDDTIVRFGNREIATANALKNVLGTYPHGWRVPMAYRRNGQEHSTVVRLAGAHREGELIQMLKQGPAIPLPSPPDRKQKKPKNEGPLPKELPKKHPPIKKPTKLPPEVADVYERRAGYANYWFNRYHQQRVWNAYLARGDFAELGWDWTIRAKSNLGGAGDTGGEVVIRLTKERGTMVTPIGESAANFTTALSESLSPPRSGGLLTTLHIWQRLLLVGPRRFGEIEYWGTLPWNDWNGPLKDRSEKLSDCLVGIYGGVETRFYFDPSSGDLVGIEMQSADDRDPCEIYFRDFREVDGRRLPHRWEIRHGDEVYASLEITSYDWDAASESQR